MISCMSFSQIYCIFQCEMVWSFDRILAVSLFAMAFFAQFVKNLESSPTKRDEITQNCGGHKKFCANEKKWVNWVYLCFSWNNLWSAWSKNRLNSWDNERMIQSRYKYCHRLNPTRKKNTLSYFQLIDWVSATRFGFFVDVQLWSVKNKYKHERKLISWGGSSSQFESLTMSIVFWTFWTGQVEYATHVLNVNRFFVRPSNTCSYS